VAQFYNNVAALAIAEWEVALGVILPTFDSYQKKREI
jgi:hypothetical protein